MRFRVPCLETNSTVRLSLHRNTKIEIEVGTSKMRGLDDSGLDRVVLAYTGANASLKP